MLRVRKLRFREVRKVVQGHTASTWEVDLALLCSHCSDYAQEVPLWRDPQLILASALLAYLKVCITPLYSSCATTFLPYQSHLQSYCQNFIFESHPSRAVFLESGRSWDQPIFPPKVLQPAFIKTKVHVRPCPAFFSVNIMNFEMQLATVSQDFSPCSFSKQFTLIGAELSAK